MRFAAAGLEFSSGSAVLPGSASKLDAAAAVFLCSAGATPQLQRSRTLALGSSGCRACFVQARKVSNLCRKKRSRRKRSASEGLPPGKLSTPKACRIHRCTAVLTDISQVTTRWSICTYICNNIDDSFSQAQWVVQSHNNICLKPLSD